MSSSSPPPQQQQQASSLGASGSSSRSGSSQDEAAGQQQNVQPEREGVQVAMLRSMSNTRIAKFNRLLGEQVWALAAWQLHMPVRHGCLCCAMHCSGRQVLQTLGFQPAVHGTVTVRCSLPT